MTRNYVTVTINTLTIASNGAMLSQDDINFIYEMEVFGWPIYGSLALIDWEGNLMGLVFEVDSPIGTVVQVIEVLTVDGQTLPGYWYTGVADQFGTSVQTHSSFASAWEQMNMDFVNLYQGVKK